MMDHADATSDTMSLDAPPAPPSNGPGNYELLVDSSSTETETDRPASGPQSSTTSVRSSVYHYVEEHGRRYHAFNQGSYLLPNDEPEQDRLELQHHLFLLTLESRLNLAPLEENVERVLDIATGTGIWAIEFAIEHPSITVVGVDLSPIQPQYIPPNCQFEVGDVEEEWLYTHKFDYVHGRALVTCFKDPKPVIEKAYEALNPGGWLELQDMIFPFKGLDASFPGTALQRWTDLVVEGAQKLGRAWNRSGNYGQYMEEVGFVDITERRFQWPIGTWPRGQHQKTLGLWFQQDLLDAVEGASMTLFTRGLKWTPDEVQKYLVEVRKDIKNRSIHSYVEIVVVYGRRPA